MRTLGGIIEMSPIESKPAAYVLRLNVFFSSQLTGKAFVSIQNPVRLDKYSEPQPDVSILKMQEDFYASHHPLPQNAFLVIEVCDTTFNIDHDIKLPLYAQAGVPEVWLADVNKKRILRFMNPTDDAYASREEFSSKDRIAPGAFPDVALDLSWFFK